MDHRDEGSTAVTDCSNDPAAEVSIITVTFNSSQVVAGLLASVPANTPTIVVDNGSKDIDELEKLCEAQSSAHLIKLDKNFGFGTACNAGAELAQTPLLFFVNPDAQLGESAIETLLDAATCYPERSVFNPRILHANGRLNLRAPSRFDGRAPGTRAATPDGDIQLSVLSGAAIFIRRTHFSELGGFDPEIFLFFEDDDLSLRLRQNGFGLYHIHNSTVIHSGRASTAPSPALTRFKNYHWMKSYAHVSEKHNYRFNWLGLVALSGWRWFVALLLANAGERHKYEGRLQALLSSNSTGPKI